MPRHLRNNVADELASFIVTVYKQCIISTSYSDSNLHSHALGDIKFRKNEKSLFTTVTV
jgi:hypothetical protein